MCMFASSNKNQYCLIPVNLKIIFKRRKCFSSWKVLHVIIRYLTSSHSQNSYETADILRTSRFSSLHKYFWSTHHAVPHRKWAYFIVFCYLFSVTLYMDSSMCFYWNAIMGCVCQVNVFVGKF